MKLIKQRLVPVNKSAACILTFLLVGWLLVFTEVGLLAEDKKAQEPLQGAAFDKQSLALRTALHYDAALNAPLLSLIRLYEKAGREEDLLALYRAHTSQYADDVGAKVVFIRLLKNMGRPEADDLILSAAQQHPKNAQLKHLLYQKHIKSGDLRALKTLSEAIELQQDKGRVQVWIGELLEQAQEGDERALAAGHLRKILTADGHGSGSLLVLARQMHRYHFEELCLESLSKAKALKPDSETGVEIELLAARAEAALGRYEAVAKRMDVLLKRVAPDYHRRREIMKLRMSLVKNDVNRDVLLVRAKASFEKEPLNEGAVLDYADLLLANQMRKKAAEVLLIGARRLPNSGSLEKEALRSLDRAGDEEALLVFLKERLKLNPSREDLLYRLIKIEYLLGQTKEGRSHLSNILEKLSKEERARRLLDLARYLRKRNQPSESAKLLEEVALLFPDRLDVQRELLETWLQLEQRSKAKKLLASIDTEGAELENFIDLLQFMIQSDFLLEARSAIELRLKKEGDRLDLNLLLVSILGKTGDSKRAEVALMKSRAQADTAARYSQWLEAGLELHTLLEQSEQFFDAEQFRFLEEGKEWSADRVDRFLSLCEIGERNQLDGRVAQALRNQLSDSSLPTPLKLRLRLLLVKALDRSPDNAGEVEEQLELLAQEDKQHMDDYHLRRALLYHSNSRPDLAKDLLAGIEIEKLADESLARAAYLVFLEYSLVLQAKKCLQKLTEIEAADTGLWEKRLSLLAALGEEQELREVLRQLLAGVKNVNLKQETLAVLRIHLLDSYWRSVSQLLKDGSTDALNQSLVMLDAVDRDAGEAKDRGWGLWARAYVLTQLNRKAASEEVVKDLMAYVKGKQTKSKEGELKNQAMIVFPDGLAMSLDAAVKTLNSQGKVSLLTSLDSKKTEGPLGKLEMAWAFEANPGARILQIEAVEEKLVLVLDDRGTVYKLDAESGKLLWHEQYGLYEKGAAKNRPMLPRAGSYGVMTGGYSQLNSRGHSAARLSRHSTMSVTNRARTGRANRSAEEYFAAGVKTPAVMVVSDEGDFFLSAGNQIRSYRGKDGSLLWQSDLSSQRGGSFSSRSGGSPVARPAPVMFLDGQNLLCYAPDLDVAVCFEHKTGKLLWSRDLTADKGEQGLVYSLNSGATFSEGSLFVFGRTCAILDSASGETLWSFDGGGVRRFPLTLDQVNKERAEKSIDSMSVSLVSVSGGALPVNTAFLNHANRDGEGLAQGGQLKPFLQGTGALLAPAVKWDSMRGQGKGGADARIMGSRLLLMGEGGLQDISLSLPIGSNHFEAKGVLLGVAGDNVWFLNGSMLKHVNLSSHEVNQVKISRNAEDEKEKEHTKVQAVMHGARIYVAQEQGLMVLNAYDGRVINNSDWPDRMKDYLVKKGAMATESGEKKIATWQGYISSIPGQPVYCFPLRDRISGARLFTMTNDSSFVMLREASNKK